MSNINTDMFTVDDDTYKGKSIAEMIDILTASFNTLQRNFPEPTRNSQISRDDVDDSCKSFREWASDPELSLKAGASKDIASQMRKILYEIGSRLDAVDNIHCRRCIINSQVKMLGDGYLAEVDAHLRSLHDKSAQAKKEMDKKKKKDSKK